jgi:hypothetical protein
VLPNFAYATVLLAAIGMHKSEALALFVIGGSALLLLFIGIHNSWDTVTYIVVTNRERRQPDPPSVPTDKA